MKNKLFSRGLRLGLVVTLLATTGCAEYHRRVLECTDECGNEFTKTLAKEYEELGKIEQDIMYDEPSADYYYRKAICAKEGKYILPTTLDKWDIERDKCPELEKAHAHLMRLLYLGARNAAPEMTASAQAHFDCWVEQQAEGWQTNDIAWCRAEFYKAISEVEVLLSGGIHQIMPKSMVLFEKNSSQLTSEAMDVVEDAAQNERAIKHHHRILVVGRTDKIGDLKHNKELSKHRAMAVKKALIQNGVPAHLISIKAAGETAGPKVEAHNRRVDIIFFEQEME
ncbi:MAG: OmpA family protein [Alphaproteobacteria bacterium]|nr:OmpA family protein [Alphaproteobacteria bacterium]